jgi:sortase A
VRIGRHHIVSLAFIACGGALAVGAPSIITLGDDYVARERGRETEAWIRQHDSAPAPAPGSDARAAAITPEGGYLLVIPRIGLRAVIHELEPDVLSGQNTPRLRRYGLGQVPYTPELRNGPPGAEGTAVIAGHRTSSGAPLRHLDLLEPGNLIFIRKGGVQQQWVVRGSVIVPPGAIDVIRSRPGTRALAIVACTPPFSDEARLVVTATLARETAERSGPGLRAAGHAQGGW